MKRSKTSRQWMKEHVSDVYVQRAKAQGYRSRAAFKLMEIAERDRLLKPGLTVVDLGAAPGGWTQVAVERVRPHQTKGVVVGIDLTTGSRLNTYDVLKYDKLEYNIPMKDADFTLDALRRGP